MTSLDRPEPVPGPASLGPVGDPSSSGTGQHGVRNKLVEAAAARLESIHWDGNGCGTDGTSACSNCFGPSPVDAREVAAEVLDVALSLIADEIAGADVKAEPYRWWHFWLWSKGFHAAWCAQSRFDAALVRSWSS